jgi:glutaconate CoA-transferase subunit A
LWGITGVQKEAVLSASRVLVTVEEIVDELAVRAGSIVLPTWVVTAVSEVPGGSWPSYAQGYSERDNRFYEEWDDLSRDRDLFRAWMAEHVLRSAGAG